MDFALLRLLKFGLMESLQIDGKRYTRESVNANVGRNDPCPCNSGKKFKKCCGIG